MNHSISAAKKTGTAAALCIVFFFKTRTRVTRCVFTLSSLQLPPLHPADTALAVLVRAYLASPDELVCVCV